MQGCVSPEDVWDRMSQGFYYLESVRVERLASYHTGCWHIIWEHLGTQMALSALTRVRCKTLDAEFCLEPGNT